MVTTGNLTMKKYTLPSYAEFVEMQPSAKPAKEYSNEYRFGEYRLTD